MTPRLCTLAAALKAPQTNGPLSSLPQVSCAASREEMLAYFDNSWALTELLFSGLVDEAAFYRRPYHQLRHPLIFYYGHPVTLYINKLRVAGLLDKPLDAELEKLFETGVDEMRWDDLHEETQHVWPPVEEVRVYRENAYRMIRNLIETHLGLSAGHAPITQDNPLWALVMGFEHERIHFETSTVLMRELPIECVKKPDAWPEFFSSPSASAPKNSMIGVAGCEVRVGKPDDYPTFGWDNEYGSETRNVRPFAASKFLISNAEFLEFVKASGYAEEKYWSRDGLSWRRFRNSKCPSFWQSSGPSGSHLYKLRTIFELIDLPLNLPVCVNFHEAKAYCAWASEQEKSDTPYRLLTEAEHHALRPGAAMANNDLRYGAESPVDAMPANDKGFHDVFGNLWQWCEDHFHPLTGAKPHAYYDDFSAPCYDGEHQLILGGSFASTGDEASAFARFHFRPHFFQHSGFRIARNTDGNPLCDAWLINPQSSYQTASMRNAYMLMHWGTDNEIYDGELQKNIAFPAVVNLPLVCAELVARFAGNKARALDLGCAVGRATFELARNFKEVIGIDYSRDFIECASALKTQGELAYQRRDSGEESTALIAQVDANIARDRVRFEQGNACALPLHIKDFDAVLLANVLCRLPEPEACLERMQGTNALVKKRGVLVMTTPLSWLEQYTPKNKWLKGLDDIAKILNEFELLHTQELPFMIREHRRKFEYIVTQASVWRRK